MRIGEMGTRGMGEKIKSYKELHVYQNAITLISLSPFNIPKSTFH
jgi:hypothetical protein